jgi:MFS family permease
MWFEIVGTTFGFIGSVIFSAALLKPTDQIRDENNTYWDGNPFTTDGELSSQPYYIAAFMFLVTGFAVSLGGGLADRFAHDNVLAAFLFCVSIALLGYLVTALFYINRVFAHQKRRVVWLKGIFGNAVQTYANDMASIEDQEDESGKFPSMKESLQKDLQEKYKQIPEPYDKEERILVQATSKATNARKFRLACEKYLNKIDKKL